MVRVLFFINAISPTSIPLELASKLATDTAATVTVASFYDAEGEYDRTLTDGPLEVVALGADSRFDRRAWAAFRRELRDGEHDVLHTHQNFSGSVARALASRSNIRVVDTEHRLHSSMTLVQNVTNAATLPIADCIVSNSHATQASFRWYERQLLNSGQLEVIHNGIDLPRLDAELAAVDEEATDSDAMTIVSVGRLVPVKDHETTLRAFERVISEHPTASLVLVGDGPCRSDLEALADTLDISHAVRFTGRISRKEVYRELAGADVFLLASRAEGFCVAAVEALAAGLPVVVSDIDVFHEVVGDAGVFATPGNVSSFTDALGQLLGDPKLRAVLGATASERVRTKFSLDSTAREYYNMYKRVA